MDVEAVVSAVRSTQNAFQVLTTTLAMTAYLFPPQAEISDGDTYDYIVVGAGSAGSIVASRLTEDPNVSVLLVEAGGDPPMESLLPAYMLYLKDSKADWNYTSVRDGMQESHINGVTELTRGKMLGGCSSLNYMQYVRGSPEDYNSWANIVQDQSWNYKNILNYFKKSENMTDKFVLNSPSGYFHGTRGNIGVMKLWSNETYKYLEAFKEIGQNIVLDIDGNMNLGYTEPMCNIADGIRQSTAYSFLSKAKDRKNLHVVKETLATRVIFDKNNNAIAVKVINENGDNVVIRANKEIILSAGSINTPQLLMLSGIGPKQHLENMGINVIANLPVGKNLQDHSSIILVYPTEMATPKKPQDPHNFPQPVIHGYVAMNKTQDYPDYQSLNSIYDSKKLLHLCAVTYAFKKEICQKFYEQSKEREILFAIISLMQPKSRGHILLRSTDPRDHPLVALGLYYDERDLENAITYIQDFDRVTGSQYFRRVNSKLLVPPQCEHWQPGSQDYWRCHARTMVTATYHYVGTCAMGSVVDSQLRVYGVNRLRIVDGSIMPTITRGNTNAPIMMIAEKAADMIKKDYRKYCN